MPEPRLAPAEREHLGELLRREAGLAYDTALEPRLADGARRAAASLGEASSADAIMRALRGDRRAIDALVEAVLVGETWFFRDIERLELVRDRFVPAALAARGRARIWSAACSTGEETYSLAAMALSAPGATSSRIEVLGTDVDETALARARAGRYRRWSLRHVPDDLRDRWLDPIDDGFRVRDALRGVTAFERLNLLEVARAAGPAGADAPPAPTAAPLARRWDVIFCRNVLMYLDADVARRVLLALAAALEEGGALVLGAAEPLLPAPILAWAPRELGGNVLVRPPDGGPAEADEGARAAHDGRPTTNSEAAPTRAKLSAPRARLRAVSPAPLPATPPIEPRLPPSPAAEDAVAAALALADGGDLDAALGRLDPDPIDPRALTLRALLLESADRPAEAARSAERALVLDPRRIEAGIVAARARLRLGETESARRHVRNTRRAAAQLPRDATLELLPETTRAAVLLLLDALERRARSDARPGGAP